MNKMAMNRMVQKKAPLQVPSQCQHCDSPIPLGISKEFCCHGCETAFGLIHDFNLGKYYKLSRKRQAPPKTNYKFDSSFYDDLNFQAEFCQSTQSHSVVCHLFLENLDCYACTWVCEKSIKRISPEAKIGINLSSGEARLEFNPNKTKLSELAQVLNDLGYPPSPNKNYKQNSHKDLTRLGVAFFCFMNIMLLATADYLGPDLKGDFYHLFRLISFGLAGITIMYAGFTFFANSYKALKQFQLHLDLPIALALLFAFVFSGANVLSGQGPVYFDSLAAIIFLLLTGRMIQKMALARSERIYMTEKSHDLGYVRTVTESGNIEFGPNTAIKCNDRIKLLPGDICPVSGIVLHNSCKINLEFMTGESHWRDILPGNMIPSGAIIGSIPAIIQANENYAQSYLYEIHRSAEQLFHQKGQFLELSAKMAKFLVLAILIITIGIFAFYAGSDLNIAIERSMATLLIACPCAFGLGAPLIIARAFHQGIKNQAIFKSQRAIEKLGLTKSFFFDKTGTLSTIAPSLELIQFESSLMSEFTFKSLLKSLPNYSSHHIPLALDQWSKQNMAPIQELANFSETTGMGIAFEFKNHQFKIGRASFCNISNQVEAAVVITMDQKFLAAFRQLETLQVGAEQLMKFLKERHMELGILSGDNKQNVEALGSRLGLYASHSELSPEQKQLFIKQNALNTAMVGNGINDSLALAVAPLSIAVQDSSLLAQENADIVLNSNNLMTIAKAITISAACRKILKRGLAFAIVFNIIGISLSATGYLYPVVAAILMPISSLTIVFISTSWEV